MALQSSRKSLQRTYPGIVGLLSALSQMGIYGPLDRIAGALTSEAVRNALYDATRSVEAMMRQSSRVKFERGEEEIIFWTSDIADPKYRLALEGKVSKVIRGPDELKECEGKAIRYIKIPFIPSREELENFLRDVEEKGFKGLSIAKEIALISLSPYPDAGG